MLSDHERRTLRELERQLLDDDPGFPRSFDARAQRLGRSHLGLPATLALVVVLMLGTALVAIGAPGAALSLATVTGLLWVAWRWRHALTAIDGSRDDPRST